MILTAMDRVITSDEMIKPRVQDVEGYRVKGGAVMPCHDCPKHNQCAAEEIACDAYRAYANEKGAEYTPSMWQGKPREPTAKTFRYIWENKTGRL